MANAQANKLFNTFVAGFITEATALNYPENSSYDEDNYILGRDGARYKRKGVDAEKGNALVSDTVISEANIETYKINSYEWNAAGGSGNNKLAVIQFGSKLFFFNAALSAVSSALIDTIDLNTYKVGSEEPELHYCSFASGKGRLFVVNKAIDPIYVTYTSGVLTVTQPTIYIRDIVGVEDSLDIDERIATLSNEHNYNLQNQGWFDGSVIPAAGVSAPITNYFNAKAVYPANSDIAYLGKASGGLWDADTQDRNRVGNTPAPIGHFVLEAFNKDRTTVSGVAGITTETETYRPIAVAFFAGRVWWSGLDSNAQNTTIFFNKIIEDDSDIGICYQEADPTSEQLSDLIATDGGTITIPEIGQVYNLEAIGDYLVVFASTGVWTIGGTDGFRADDFFVRKISSVGVLSQLSVVTAENVPFYITNGGIYTLSADKVTGRLSADNVSIDKIQKFYLNDIPTKSLPHMKATYCGCNKIIHWLYNSDPNFDGVTDVNHYDSVLVLDLTLGAFYKFSFSELTTESPYVVGMFNAATDNLVLDINDAAIKLIMFVPGVTDSITVGEYINADFVDFYFKDQVGSAYTAFVETSFDLGEDILRNKQVKYISPVFNKTESTYSLDSGNTVINDTPSGCFLQARWDWNTSSAGNKWSTSRQVYRPRRTFIPQDVDDTHDDGTSVVISKNRLRGSGKALQLRFESEAGKDTQLLGWMISFEGRTNV